MTSQSVIEKRVVVIDGREHTISSTSWTQSINETKKDGYVTLETDDDIIEYIKSEN